MTESLKIKKQSFFCGDVNGIYLILKVVECLENFLFDTKFTNFKKSFQSLQKTTDTIKNDELVILRMLLSKEKRLFDKAVEANFLTP